MENVPSSGGFTPNADGSVAQNWASYTAAEHARWDQLFARQTRLLRDHAADEFLDGLSLLRLSDGGIPNVERLSETLMQRTGWQIITVPRLIPDALFFDHLAHRRFVAGRFIRTADQMDYLQEPDIFHDIFGHVPMLAHPIFADYMQAYGQAGLRASGLNALPYLARLYWYSIEFGLILQNDDVKLYGAGLVSSFGECGFALRDPSPHRIKFDLQRVMRTDYRIDDFQQCYFVIDSFDDLLTETRQQDFAPLYRDLAQQPSLSPATLLPSDAAITRGTQDYARQQAGRAARDDQLSPHSL
ncbi:phenylalanine 4-monooxygenase [Sphingopyxis yananensis]|uniref:phenylalanine 4-monooxygenase n=1 Tax=Sphingopyxis yananensis TaxID=2886687 RepID=UPI001D10F5E1|nr:phenylalanine 4-monooxygenase [Sphingopyxis yananensis]MCC2603690.1 phenylalanine 4-monooxygenase [Sphingopyxis yananensis]